MEVTLKQLIESEGALIELAKVKGLRQNISFRIGTRVIKPVRKALDAHRTVLNQLIQSYGECKVKDEAIAQPDDWFINPRSPRWKDFSNYREQVEAEKVTIPLDEPIKLSELGEVDLPPAVYDPLSDWLLAE